MAIPGSNIRLLRQQMGLSQRALAKAADMDVAALSRLEAGKSGALQQTIERIAQTLNVSIGVLYAETEIVEAAALRMRRVPVLTEWQLRNWKGPETIELDDHQPYLHTGLQVASRFAFGFVVQDEANSPLFHTLDELIFDPNVQPSAGGFVVAQDPHKTYIGRLRLIRGQQKSSSDFEVIPCDISFPIGSTSASGDLVLRGTLVELRRYFHK